MLIRPLIIAIAKPIFLNRMQQM